MSLPKEPHLADAFLTCLKGAMSLLTTAGIQRGHQFTLTLFNLHGASLWPGFCSIEREFDPHLSRQSGFPGSSDSRESACNVGVLGSVPELEDPLEKEMATHSSTLAWETPWTEEPGGL